MTTLENLCRQVEAESAAATKDWKVYSHADPEDDEQQVFEIHDQWRTVLVINEWGTENKLKEANATFIATIRDFAPKAERALPEAYQLAQDAVQAFQDYSIHRDDCSVMKSWPQPIHCNCGLFDKNKRFVSRLASILAEFEQPKENATPSVRPKVVCLCGSSKYPEHHMRAMMAETLAGRIVVPMGLYGHADFPVGAKAATNDGDEATEVKQRLDRLHFAKIDLADEILVVNVGGYIGSSTAREIEYATKTGKGVRFTEP